MVAVAWCFCWRAGEDVKVEKWRAVPGDGTATKRTRAPNGSLNAGAEKFNFPAARTSILLPSLERFLVESTSRRVVELLLEVMENIFEVQAPSWTLIRTFQVNVIINCVQSLHSLK